MDDVKFNANQQKKKKGHILIDVFFISSNALNVELLKASSQVEINGWIISDAHDVKDSLKIYLKWI